MFGLSFNNNNLSPLICISPSLAHPQLIHNLKSFHQVQLDTKQTPSVAEYIDHNCNTIESNLQ
jgi:hypothetical protein